MFAIPLLALVLVGAPQDPPVSTSAPTPPDAVKTAPRFSPEQEQQIKQKEEQIRLSREPERQEAVRINELAANIHSQADARKLVDAVAKQLIHQRHLFWAGQKYRHRVAHAEFAAVTDPAGLIAEDRIVALWNDYVREIKAPEEALITAAELHNFRTLDFHFSQRNWEREMSQSLWSMPNIYAVDSSGSLAEGCRALEALKLVNNLHEQFFRLHFARQQLRATTSEPGVGPKKLAAPAITRGRMATAEVATLDTATPRIGISRITGTTTAAATTAGTLQGHIQRYQDPIRPAVARYQQEHGEQEYNELVRRLFDELFPAQ
jgi:hypothetical protein